MAKVEAQFHAARTLLVKGEDAPLFNPSDTAAWYIFQARAYAQNRRDWVPEQAVRIAPVLTRIGTDLSELLRIPGAEDVARRLMNQDRSQPDDGLYELVVARAYQRHGWDVAFVPTKPGIAKTHDLNVTKGRRRWAVECKRMARSADHLREIERAKTLAHRVHQLARMHFRSLEMKVAFRRDPATLPDDILERRAAAYPIGCPRPLAGEDMRRTEGVFRHAVGQSIVNGPPRD